MYVPLNKYFQIDKKGTNFHYHFLRVTHIIMTYIVKIEIQMLQRAPFHKFFKDQRWLTRHRR